MTGRSAGEDQLGRLADGLRVDRGLAGGSRAGRRVVGPVPLHRRAAGSCGSTMSLGTSMSTGPGPAGGGDVERLADDPGDVLAASVTRKLCLVTGSVMPVVSHSWKASVPMAAVRHLAGDDDHRDRVHVGVAQRRDDVGGRRAAGHHGHAGPAGGVGVALGHVAGALLVAHEDVADRRVDDRVVHGEDAAAREPEDRVDALHLERLDQRLAAVGLHAGSEFHVVSFLGCVAMSGTRCAVRGGSGRWSGRGGGPGARNGSDLPVGRPWAHAEGWSRGRYVSTTRRIAGRNIDDRMPRRARTGNPTSGCLGPRAPSQ